MGARKDQNLLADATKLLSSAMESDETESDKAELLEDAADMARDKFENSGVLGLAKPIAQDSKLRFSIFTR